MCLGTSLSGMNADRVARTVAGRSFRNEDYIGTIIINLQQYNNNNNNNLLNLFVIFNVCAGQIWTTGVVLEYGQN